MEAASQRESLDGESGKRKDDGRGFIGGDEVL